jgi:F-type H+-transporting ATPase subunit b
MQEILHSLGDLFLASTPTFLLFVLLVIAYQVLVQGPLSRTLEERRARTSGAVEAADKAIATAQERTEEYAGKLRQARTEVFRLREQRQQQAAREREAALEAARNAAAQRVLEARLSIDTEAAAAKNTILAGVDMLAEQVVRAVMPAAAGGSR